MKWVAVLAVGVSATAAAAQTTAVRVVKDQSALTKCSELGEVRGSNFMGSLFASAAYDDILNQMKAKTAAAGGTHVLLVNITADAGAMNGLGEAYRCP